MHNIRIWEICSLPVKPQRRNIMPLQWWLGRLKLIILYVMWKSDAEGVVVQILAETDGCFKVLEKLTELLTQYLNYASFFLIFLTLFQSSPLFSTLCWSARRLTSGALLFCLFSLCIGNYQKRKRKRNEKCYKIHGT